MEKNSVNYKYLVRSPRDIDWGITVDTVGSEPIPPNYPVYPPRTGHPDAFYFTMARIEINGNHGHRDDNVRIEPHYEHLEYHATQHGRLHRRIGTDE